MKILIYTAEVILKNYLPLTKMFRQHGWQVEVINDELECLHLLRASAYSVILVLADKLPVDVLHSYFAKFQNLHLSTLFGVITKLDSYTERARCIGMGMDFYYISPFSYTQLLHDLTLKVHLKEERDTQFIEAGQYKLDLLSRCAYVEDKPLYLTRIQFELFALFLRRRGVVLSRVQIWEEIWGYGDYPLANTIDVHVNRLRHHLSSQHDQPIKTVYGVGYQMDDTS